jgi:hypothetical protein
VEDRCQRIPFVPYEERKHRGIALAKRADYFSPETQAYAWPGILSGVVSQIEPDVKGATFEIVATASGNVDPQVGVRNLGQLPRDEWLDAVAHSKFMVRDICMSQLPKLKR